MKDRSEPAHSLSTAVCASCRSRKQKCDRLLPRCSRCERLFLKCHYHPTATATIPLDRSCSSRNQNDDSEHNLNNELMYMQNDTRPRLTRLSAIMNKYKRLFDTMSDIFLFSCQDWLRVLHTEDFRQHRVITGNNAVILDRGIMALILAMSVITRPLSREKKSGTFSPDEPDLLRNSMYVIAKQLFFMYGGDTETVGIPGDSVAVKPTLALIQAGLLLSVYEYGQGSLDSSYMTLSVCSSMAMISGLWTGQHQLPPPKPPVPGYARSQDDDILQTLWGIVIHERMISVKTSIPIRPLDIIINRKNMLLDNERLEAEIQSMMPNILENAHYASFYLQARSAIWLDLVLELVRRSNTTGTTNSSTANSPHLRFQELDRGLLRYLGILVQLGMGTCCEAIAIALNAFFHLHKWRLSLSDHDTTTNTKKADSLRAIETILKVLTDISTDHIPGVIFKDEAEAEIHRQAINHGNSNTKQEKDKEAPFSEIFPYTLYMIYLLLVEMRSHQLRQDGPPSSSSSWRTSRHMFAMEIRAMRQVLDLQTKRWKAALDYIALLDNIE